MPLLAQTIPCEVSVIARAAGGSSTFASRKASSTSACARSSWRTSPLHSLTVEARSASAFPPWRRSCASLRRYRQRAADPPTASAADDQVRDRVACPDLTVPPNRDRAPLRGAVGCGEVRMASSRPLPGCRGLSIRCPRARAAGRGGCATPIMGRSQSCGCRRSSPIPGISKMTSCFRSVSSPRDRAGAVRLPETSGMMQAGRRRMQVPALPLVSWHRCRAFFRSRSEAPFSSSAPSHQRMSPARQRLQHRSDDARASRSLSRWPLFRFRSDVSITPKSRFGRHRLWLLSGLQ